MTRGPVIPLVAPKKVKRFGWHRVYDDFPTHPKWRLVAARSGARLTEVVALVEVLFCCAAKNRKNGWIGNFDPYEAGVALDLSPDIIVNIYRALEDQDWIDNGFIVDWQDRNPDREDPTAAQRQRNSRARKAARRKFAMGQPLTEEEHALLSRVTTLPPPPEPLPRGHGAFAVVEPVDETPEAIADAKLATEANASAYLLGGGTGSVYDWGPASAVVADRAGMRRMAADTTIRRWLTLIGGDKVTLASLIDDCHHDGLRGESFIRLIEQRIGQIAACATRGPALPLPPAAIRGGRNGG